MQTPWNCKVTSPRSGRIRRKSDAAASADNNLFIYYRHTAPSVDKGRRWQLPIRRRFHCTWRPCWWCFSSAVKTSPPLPCSSFPLVSFAALRPARPESPLFLTALHPGLSSLFLDPHPLHCFDVVCLGSKRAWSSNLPRPEHCTAGRHIITSSRDRRHTNSHGEPHFISFLFVFFFLPVRLTATLFQASTTLFGVASASTVLSSQI